MRTVVRSLAVGLAGNECCAGACDGGAGGSLSSSFFFLVGLDGLRWVGWVRLGPGFISSEGAAGSLRGWVRCWCVSSWLREFGLVCGHDERSLGQQTNHDAGYHYCQGSFNTITRGSFIHYTVHAETHNRTEQRSEKQQLKEGQAL